MKDSTNTLYSLAVAVVRSASETKQAELDAAAAVARQKNIDDTRAAAIEGVPPDSPAYPVCALVAQTLTIGPEYPTLTVPPATMAVVFAAIQADMLPSDREYHRIGSLAVYKEGHLKSSGVNDNEDYHAWNNAKEYRKRQTWEKL